MGDLYMTAIPGADLHCFHVWSLLRTDVALVFCMPSLPSQSVFFASVAASLVCGCCRYFRLDLSRSVFSRFCFSHVTCNEKSLRSRKPADDRWAIRKTKKCKKPCQALLRRITKPVSNS